MESLISVALRFLPDKNNAPEILASGRGVIAEKIRYIAEKNDIPVVEDQAAAGALIQFPEGTEIPPELYDAVAAVFGYIYSLDKR